ncbi:MAG: hypothetical protein AAGH65_07520, partial [Pseudomonadota bacterium]
MNRRLLQFKDAAGVCDLSSLQSHNSEQCSQEAVDLQIWISAGPACLIQYDADTVVRHRHSFDCRDGTDYFHESLARYSKDLARV